jgi:1,2-diacylglycerol 3-beta-galactosyltransferase
VTKRILILFSDTGGGHRSSAEALREALLADYSDQCRVEITDFFLHGAPFPFRRFPDWYPWMVRRRRIWRRGFILSDGPWRSRALSTAVWPAVRQAVRRFVAEHPADVIVSVHPLFQVPVLRALGRARPTFLTVVTDLVSTHALWYHPGVDHCYVPTERARVRALACGLSPGQVEVIGLPIAAKFRLPQPDRSEARAALGWLPGLPTVLLMGGGDGLGPILEMAQAVDQTRLPLQLAVVAGRNEVLRRRLEATRWGVPAHIYGFVTNMPELMAGADMIVTKAGPSSISEAFSAGLPIILSGALPGQEEGNVDYVVREGAGIWAPRPVQVAEAVRAWLESPGDRLRAAAQNARRLAQPEAAVHIAREIACWAGLPAVQAG